MSEYYVNNNYHRWEPLAEFHFNINDYDYVYYKDNFLYCLFSRTLIREGVKSYVAKEDGSESDMEILRDSASQGWEDQSHVHFSLDTSHKVKCEKDEGASCYCSASHTDNCCSTDEHDAVQVQGMSHALQPSDSGADLTYQECHSEYTNTDKLERMDQDFTPTDENYLSEGTWEKFWAINGERLIWASWIKKYSDYINPGYLDDNNDLAVDEKSIHKQKSVDQIYKEFEQKNEDNDMRERKFSYDSKVNPYKKRNSQNQAEKIDKRESKDESWLPSRKRSCSEHERILSPRTLPATDSLTNVTKITLSSFNVTSSHVTSESSPTDDSSVSSSTSDDQSNDQTRIANIETADPTSVDDMDTDQYWQLLWKKHFGEQLALHYANYIEMFNAQDKELPIINIEVTTPIESDTIKTVVEAQETQEKALEIERENSEGNSQELPTVVEVQAQVEEMNLYDTDPTPRKRGKKKSKKYLGSVGVLLKHLLREGETDNYKDAEVTEAGDGNGDKREREAATETAVEGNSATPQQSISNTNFLSYSYDDGDDEPPDDIPINLKRSHELDYEEAEAEKIKETFEMMGFCIDANNMPKGHLVFRKKASKLKPPSYKNTKKFGVPRKTYFDDDGNPFQLGQSNYSQDDVMHPDQDMSCPDFRSEARRLLDELSHNTGNNEEIGGNESETVAVNQPGPENITDKRNSDLEEAEERNTNQSVTDDMNLDANESVTLDNKALKQSADKIMKLTLQASKSPNEDFKTQDINRDESGKENETKHSNNSANTTAVEKKGDEQDLTTDDDNPEQMNVDSNNSEQKDVTRNNSTEAAVDNDNANNSTEELTEKSEDFDNYDVKNTVESNVSEESNALEAADVPFPDDFDQSSDESKPEAEEDTATQNVETAKRRRRQKRYAKLDEEERSNVPAELRDDPVMMKYWKKRHSLFHKFDEGIRLDRESWFSVTPESVARHIAHKYTYDTVLDAFCGAGGNTIQFAFTSKKVIAIDIDPGKIAMARHNAAVYGVADRIQFLVGDFFELAPQLEADMVFLSPPWGGPEYSNNAMYNIETMLVPKPASELVRVARTISPTISLYLPRNSRPDQILALAKGAGGSVELEQSFLDRRFVAITAYFY